jgi:hypothetical protein
MYGATAFSRTGLAGGRKGCAGRRWYGDPTVWWAILFGLMPDILSMWTPFAMYFISGRDDNYFLLFGGGWLIFYHAVHSLVAAAAVSGLCFALCRPIFIPSLAWTLHVLIDSVSHGTGKWHTMLFYPFSTWGIEGINWWEHPGLIQAFWMILPAVWFALSLWRRRQKAT